VAEPVRFVSRFGHPSPALWFRLLWRVFPSASGFMLPCQAARRTRRGTGWPAYLPKK